MASHWIRPDFEDISIGAEFDSVLWIGIVLLAVGAFLAAGAALAINAGARRR